uniref:Secreted protein n=1 Tax=Macrostomum lignano TaxID=282301 RepID=A0A1I8IDA6_9PLAT
MMWAPLASASCALARPAQPLWPRSRPQSAPAQ